MTAIDVVGSQEKTDALEEDNMLVKESTPINISLHYPDSPLLAGCLILVVLVCDRIAYSTVQTNLAMYGGELLGNPQIGVNLSAVFMACVFAMPFLGAYLVDIKIGCFKTVVFGTCLEIVGYGLVCIGSDTNSGATFYIGLMVFVAIGTSCVQSAITTLVSNQFDSSKPALAKKQSLFFSIHGWVMNASAG